MVERELVTVLEEADVGRRAITAQGTWKIEVVSVHADGDSDDAYVITLEDSQLTASPDLPFAMIGGSEKVYWIESREQAAARKAPKRKASTKPKKKKPLKQQKTKVELLYVNESRHTTRRVQELVLDEKLGNVYITSTSFKDGIEIRQNVTVPMKQLLGLRVTGANGYDVSYTFVDGLLRSKFEVFSVDKEKSKSIISA